MTLFFFFFLPKMSLHWHIIITQGPWFTLGLTVGVLHSVGLDKCRMTSVYDYNRQSVFPVLKILSALSGISFWFFLGISISLLTFHICSYILPAFPLRTHSMLLIVVLNSWSDYSNVSAVSESGSDAWSMLSNCFLPFSMVSAFVRSWTWCTG